MKKAQIPQKIIIAMLKMLSFQKQKKLCEHMRDLQNPLKRAELVARTAKKRK
jgi:hypothetical protein